MIHDKITNRLAHVQECDRHRSIIYLFYLSSVAGSKPVNTQKHNCNTSTKTNVQTTTKLIATIVEVELGLDR